MTSILFIALYLALPMGSAALALLGCRPTEEEALEPVKIIAPRERRRPY